jgi:hypothetical protein
MRDMVYICKSLPAVVLCIFMITLDGNSQTITNCKKITNCTSTTTSENGICNINMEYLKCDSSIGFKYPACIENECRTDCSCSCQEDKSGFISWYDTCRNCLVDRLYDCSGCD